jgi:hypothetical protein
MNTLEKILLILCDSYCFETLSSLFFNDIHVPRAIHFSLVAIIFQKCTFLSKLASQLVTSTPWEMFFGGMVESTNQNFNFVITKFLILYIRSNFSRGCHL